MYVLYNLIINSIIIFATSIIYFVVTGSDFNKLTICGLLIGNIIGLPFRWIMNEEKYKLLINI